TETAAPAEVPCDRDGCPNHTAARSRFTINYGRRWRAFCSQACLEAVRVIDREIGRVLKVAIQTDTTVIITSDHGNLEEVLSPTTGQIETQHDANPVPLYLIGSAWKGRKFFNWSHLTSETTGILADIAPTVLEIMGLPKPAEMTGRSLLKDLLR
ncbi:MAG: hypothetical protein AAB867_01485, partial [Patescibacteria group bacterium]